ncbi:MAG TPA: HDOD domain-containing protein [Persephonella sp.]|uniref:Putative diguanylate phosphodiesterase n=1 Tax=Persephonella marina (strain DSM 14350 / EX-H1) TaxID=123214 RepID=C0QTA6_PERMH|nr:MULTISPECIES: HDOD domain-containing protein [Persephonella]ACO04195.1 putative diguanylate phosphodiesterase [Persephonella marina EX-H1]HCB70460.1 HDOD domain-containing protein [Persephonella sp.]
MPISGEVYLSKIPLLDKNKRIFAYELTLKDKEENPIPVEDFAEILANISLERIAGHHLLFIKVDPHILDQEILDYIPEEKTVLYITKINEDIIPVIKQLKSIGFRFAFPLNKDFETTKNLADYVFFNVSKLKDELIKKLVTIKFPFEFVLEGIKDEKEFEYYISLGYKLFRGDFILRPQTIVGKTIEPSKAAIIQLFNQINEEFDPKKIEEIIKKNPDLSVSLLKYINSAVFSFREKITSIRHAISILGQKNLMQWLLLYMYRTSDDTSYAETLLELAAERGKTMEIIFEKLKLPKEEVEKAFLVGVLSLMDKLLKTPKEEFVKELNLDEEINEALVRYEGKLGKVLLIVEKIEEGNLQEISHILEDMKLSINDIMAAQVQAYAWFEDVNIV